MVTVSATVRAIDDAREKATASATKKSTEYVTTTVTYNAIKTSKAGPKSTRMVGETKTVPE